MDQMDHLCCSPTTELYSEIRRKKIRVHTTAWIDLNNIALCERSQTQNSTYMTLFT